MSKIQRDELVQAVQLDDIKAVRRIVKDTGSVLKSAGADALMWAADLGRVEITKLLLKAGVDPNSSWGNETALQRTVGRGGNARLEVARLLLENGANMRGALTAACRFPDMIELLLGHGADAKDAREDGVTALMRAASEGAPKTVRLLIERGADMSATDFAGKTALHYAANYSASVGCLERIQQLVDAGADVNARSHSGDTPLICAARAGWVPVVRLLLAAGADAKAVNKKRQTAQKAAQNTARCVPWHKELCKECADVLRRYVATNAVA